MRFTNQSDLARAIDDKMTASPEEYFGMPLEKICIYCGTKFETYDPDIDLCTDCIEDLSKERA